MRRNIAALLALVTSACTGWRTETAPMPDAASSASTKARTVRLTLHDGRILDLARPAVIRDSVVGYTRDGRPDFARTAVAVKDVKSVATYGFDGPATTMLVLAIVGATGALVAACVASFANI